MVLTCELIRNTRSKGLPPSCVWWCALTNVCDLYKQEKSSIRLRWRRIRMPRAERDTRSYFEDTGFHWRLNQIQDTMDHSLPSDPSNPYYLTNCFACSAKAKPNQVWNYITLSWIFLMAWFGFFRSIFVIMAGLYASAAEHFFEEFIRWVKKDSRATKMVVLFIQEFGFMKEKYLYTRLVVRMKFQTLCQLAECLTN